MDEPLRVTAGDLSAAEFLEVLEEERRVVVETEVLGSPHEVTLRYDGDRFYCDTPTTLHVHDDSEEMTGCLRRMGYTEE